MFPVTPGKLRCLMSWESGGKNLDPVGLIFWRCRMAKMIIEPGRCVDGYECPVCSNDEIELGQLYCQICGEPLEWLEACDSED